MSTANDHVVKPGGARSLATPRMVLLVVAFAAGIVVGRSLAYETSRGGLGGIIGAGLWVYGTILGIVVVLVVTAIAARLGNRGVVAALRPVVVAALVLAAGAVGGNVTAAFTGGVYREAATLTSAGTITLRLDGEDTYRLVEAGSATCTSVPDGLDVAGVTGLELGLLGDRHLRGSVSLPFGNEASARAELWIDGADLPDGAAQPTWSGPATIGIRPGEDRPGLATFDALALAHDPKLPPYGEAFPETLSGGFDWSCAPFSPN